MRTLATPEEVDALVQQWLAEELVKDAAARADTRFAEDWTRPGEAVGARAAAMLLGEAEDSLFEWREVLARHDWQQAKPEANLLLKRHGLELAHDSEIYRLLCMSICIAMTEFHGVRIERSLGRWNAKPQTLPLFGAPGTVSEAPPQAAESSLPLGQAITQFLDEMRRIGGVRPKRLMDFDAALRLLAKRIGAAKPVSQIGRAEIGELRVALTKLPPNFTKLFPGRDLDAMALVAAERELPLLDPKTVNHKYLAVFDTFFQWCISCGYAAENPAKDVRVKMPGAGSVAGRGTFRVDELKAVFSAPLFVGCRSGGRIYEAGDHQVGDYRYWVPLLGLFTGARLGELCQLAVNDVREVEGVWCIDISPEDGKSVKTRAGRRPVPLHPELHRLGFVRHVQKALAQSQQRLFPEIEAGKGGYLSENPSKWFGRFLRSALGKEHVKARRLAFHSFRHTMKDALRAAGVEERVQDALLGHENDHVSALYGEGYKPPRLLAELSKVQFAGLDLSGLYAR